MNPWQLAQQIRHVLQELTWTGGGLIFGDVGVVVTAGEPVPGQIPHGTPTALVMLTNGVADEEHPADLVLQQFSVALLAHVAGDPTGQNAILGGPIPVGGQTSSANRGVLELETEVVEAIGALYGADGLSIIAKTTGSQAASREDGTHGVAKMLEMEAWCTQRPEYAPPINIRQDGSNVEWDGDQCVSRFDFVEFVVSVAGTPVYVGPLQSAAVAPTTGELVSVQAGYATRPGGAATNYSVEQVGAVLTWP